MADRLQDFVLDSLYQHVDSLVVCLSQGGKIVSLNHQAEHILGLRLGEVGRADFMKVCPDFPYADHFNLEIPRKASGLKWTVGSTKSQYTLMLTIVPVFHESMSESQYLLIGKDVTQEVRSKSGMSEINERLKQYY